MAAAKDFGADTASARKALESLGIADKFEIIISKAGEANDFKSLAMEDQKSLMKDSKFANIQSLKTKLLTELDKDFPSEDFVYILTETEKYVILRCKFSACKFQHWFNREKGAIVYFRNINWQHIIASHVNGNIRDLGNTL